MFNIETYQTRRAKLIQRISTGVILFLGNQQTSINFRDNHYPFRQDSSFLYYFGIAFPDLAAIIDVDENRTILFGDELGVEDIIWMGKVETLNEKAARAGISLIEPSGSLSTVLATYVRQGRRIHYLPPYRSSNCIKLFRCLGIALDRIPQAASEELIRAIVAQRSLKSDEEIVEIEKAVEVSVEMQLTAMKMAKPGISEQQLAAEIQYVAQRSGYGLAYPTILTVRGEVLHNHYYGNTLKEGQLVLNDSGAETAMGYAGDLTRTFPVSGKFTALQRDVYEVVLESIERATDMLRPGVRFLDIHWLACQTLVEGLKGLGLMRGDTQEAVERGAHTLFFQCGTGHLMGLDVHDMEDLGEQYVGYTDRLQKDTTTFGLKSLRLGRELQAGFVLTVEPGLYFIPELIDQWRATDRLSEFINYAKMDTFRDFGGIRIEDDILITENGHRVLSDTLIKTAADIDDVRSG